MKITFTVLLLIFSCGGLKAQISSVDTKLEETDSLKVYTAVEQNPEFPGGYKKMNSFIDDNNTLKSATKSARGSIVISFIIERNGSISAIKIEKGFTPEADAEAVRIMKLSPKWKPGLLNGKTARVKYTLPIKFGYQ